MGVDIKAVENELKKYKTLKYKAEMYQRKLDKLDYDFSIGGPKDPGAIQYDSIKVKGGHSIHATLDTAEAIINDYYEKAEKYEALRDEYQRQADKLFDAVCAGPLDAEEIAFIDLRYFEGLPVKKVCQKCYISETTAWRIKRTALEKLAFLVEDERF